MKADKLTAIVRSVEAQIVCPKCGSHFVAGSLDIVDITGDRGTFAAHCQRCNTTTLTAMNLRDVRYRVENHDRQVAKVAFEKISPTDVVSFKQFLNDFDGNFQRELASEKAVRERKVDRDEA